MKNFIQPGQVMTVIAGGGGMVSGDGVVVGDLFGVSSLTVAAGEESEVVLTGVFSLPKAAGAISQGARVYWDNAAKNITLTAAGNKFAGYAFLAATGGATEVRVMLSPKGDVAGA